MNQTISRTDVQLPLVIQLDELTPNSFIAHYQERREEFEHALHATWRD